jgi:6-pyruvoyltetrahydropterin/6-carboxytetrahydropterin synthase
MTSVTRRVRWEAAHFLPFPNVGKCSRVHGHSWSAEVELSGPVKTEGPDAGMIVDMGEVGRYFRDELEDGLDHRLLNDTLPAEYQPPTTENVARYLLDAFVAGGFPVVSVMVRETENQTATVRAS